MCPEIDQSLNLSLNWILGPPSFSKMALFGWQLATTIIVATFVTKLSPFISPSDYLCTKLKFYFVAVGNEQDKKRRKTDLCLQKILLRKTELEAITYYEDFRRIVNYTFATVVVFLSNSLYWVLYPSSAEKEFNFVTCWVGVVLVLWVTTAVRVTKLYFTHSSFQSEGKLCIASTVTSVIASSFLLYLGDDYFHPSVSKVLLSFQHKHLPPLPNGFAVYGILILLSGLIGASLTFPAFRLAQEHRNVVKQTDLSKLTKLLCYAHFYCPLLIVLSFFKPLVLYIVYDLFEFTIQERNLPRLTCVLIVLYVILTVLMAKRLLQGYLDKGLALFQLHTKRDGKEELSNMVASIPQYFGVALSQLALPVVLVLSLALLSITTRPYLCCFHYTEASAPVDSVLIGGIFSYLLMFSVCVLTVFSFIGTLYYSNNKR